MTGRERGGGRVRARPPVVGGGEAAGGEAAGDGVRVDSDFARAVLTDLYRYSRKRGAVAWLWWALLGWAGGHRFYLGRHGTGLLMLFTGGGGLIWWLVDAALIGSMVRQHNEEQERRERDGRPPLAMDFMPALTDDVLERPPEWTRRWRARSPLRRKLRFAGDVVVITFAAFALGSLAGMEGVAEAMAAIVALAGVTMVGGVGSDRLRQVPVVRDLVRWSHRLRLFYYINEPGSPPALLLRGATGAVLAPFRNRDRAEVRLYLELGAAFTLAFVVMDLVPELLLPLLGAGEIELAALLTLWVTEAATTFVVIYAFAAPIGAVITLYLLTRPTHGLPRLLSVLTLLLMGVGAIWPG